MLLEVHDFRELQRPRHERIRKQPYRMHVQLPEPVVRKFVRILPLKLQSFGYDSYPGCYLSCTAQANCSGHATSVSGNVNSGCTCQCSNKWTWFDCANCPTNYSASADCAACASGFGGYPNCVRNCDVNTDCSGHASNVTGLEGSCVCACTNKWSGSDCSQCTSNYDAIQDCAACADGYDSYPNCYLTCTTAANCSGKANAVTGNSHTGCNCTCRNQWRGSGCDECPVNYTSGGDCDSCASGYVNYPQCPRVCTVAEDCNGHADNVTGGEGSCVCGCQTIYS